MRVALLAVILCACNAAGAAPAHHVVDAGAGWRFACALLDDGTVRCWGDGMDGQVGDGTGEPRNRPVAVIATDDSVVRGTTGTPLTGAIGLAVGNEHACALLQGGTVKCWGDGAYSPRVVLDHAVEIGAGKAFTCARLDDGSVRCWGAMSFRGKIATAAVAGLGKVARLAIGDANPCAVLADGTVACWSLAKPAVDQGITGATEAWADASHGGCARTTAGIACWGGVAAPAGSVAFASWGDREHCVVDDTGAATCTGSYPAKLAHVRKTASGGTLDCAVMTSGELRCWGSTDYGQVGDGGGAKRMAPVRVQNLGAADALWVGEASCARAGGHVACWGANGDDQLGHGSPANYAAAPVAFPALDAASQISIADGNGCALFGDEVRCWNRDSDGVPTKLAGLASTRELAVAQEHACARLADDTVACWGDSLGVLGRGGSVPDGDPGGHPPDKVVDVSGVAQLAAGTEMTCARLATGKVRCWGRSGVLGDGRRVSTAWVTTASTVKSLADATSIAVNARGSAACAIRKDRTLACWGHEVYGELGDWDREQDQVDRLVPVVAKGVSDVVAVAVGDGTTCVLVAGGEVRCFGGNQYGEVADGTTEVRVHPTKVMTDVVELGAHDNTVCARKTDGSVWCWGRGDFGAVGDGAPDIRATPYPVTFD